MKKQKGFSLIEMVVYLAIFSLLITVVLEMFLSILNVQQESEATSSVEQDGRFILLRLMYDINKAEIISIPATLGEETNSLQINIEGIGNIYSLDDNNLILTNNQGTDQLNSFNTQISVLTFKRLGNISGKNSVRINLTIKSKIGKNVTLEEKSWQTTVGLR